MMKRTIEPQRTGFTLVELLLTIGIISILMSVIIGAINPGKRIGSARDAIRKNDLSALTRAIQAYWTTHAATFPGGPGTTYTSTEAYGGDPPDASGYGWIPADLTAEMKTIPVDPINNVSHWYQYYADPAPGSDKFKLQTPVESDYKAAEEDGGILNNCSQPSSCLYETGTDKKLTIP